jgi:phosphatidylinositol glycan class T
MDGVFTVTIENNDDAPREAIYSEIWPWWVKGWLSEMELRVDGTPANDLLESIAYHPAKSPHATISTVHLTLSVPPRSHLVITIPFTKLTLKYTEHRPDAERGREISSGILTLLNGGTGKGFRPRIYTSRLLLDVPTPDFSMPYNVIIMSSTVMAVFFGLMHGSLTRKWGWVELPLPAKA